MTKYPEPTTEAGKGLLDGIQQTSERLDVALNALDYIQRIEAESAAQAVAAALAGLEAKVEGLPRLPSALRNLNTQRVVDVDAVPGYVELAAVLTILANAGTEADRG